MMRHSRTLESFLALVDAALAVAGYLAAWALRSGPLSGALEATPGGPGAYAFLAIAAIPLLFVLNAHFGVHASPARKTPRQVVGELLRSHAAAALVLAALVFLFQQKTMSRAVFVLFLAFLFAGSAASRLAARALVLAFSRPARSRVVLAGRADRAKGVADVARRHPEIGIDVMGFVPGRSDEDPFAESDGLARLAPPGQVAQAVRSSGATDVFLCAPLWDLDAFEAEAKEAEAAGAAVHAALAFEHDFLVRALVDDFHAVPAVPFRAEPPPRLALAVKRAVDVAGSLALLFLLGPVFVAIGALVKLTSKGPVLHRQVRCGKDGREFVLLKFRSMVQGAEKEVDRVRHLNRMEAPAFKAPDDPRVTAFGKLLRKFSLDELPQLANVFRGDMSLVGPRPPLPEEVANYLPWQRKRLRMKPGLTGLWQVSGRNRIDSFDDWVTLDLYYIDNWSPGLDLLILTRTVPVVLLGRGGL